MRARRSLSQPLGGREPGKVLGTRLGTLAQESWVWGQEDWARWGRGWQSCGRRLY